MGRHVPPNLAADLQEALHIANTTGVDPLLWVVFVAMCERWFRIATPTRSGIERELRRRLSMANYTPYGDGDRLNSERRSVLARYVVHGLCERWEPDASPAMSESLRHALRGSIKALGKELAAPVLVVEHRRLPRKQGGYPEWGPWVAAAALYADVRERFPRQQDSRALKVALALLKALHGTVPDKAEFRRKRRRIERVAPAFVERMVRDLRHALKAYEKPDSEPKWRVEYLLKSGTFDSLEEWGGLQLLVGRATP
jgi:hypothetical protein